MSRPTTPPAVVASGAHCLPARAWSTRRQTTPHARARPPPPRSTQRHPSSAHATHTGTAVSPSHMCHRGVRGLSAVRHALRPRQPGAPNPVELRRDGCADRGSGRPGEALTQTNPPPPPLCQQRLRCAATTPWSNSAFPDITFLLCPQSRIFMAVGRIVVAVAQKFRHAGVMPMHVRSQLKLRSPMSLPPNASLPPCQQVAVPQDPQRAIVARSCRNQLNIRSFSAWLHAHFRPICSNAVQSVRLCEGYLGVSGFF